MVPNDYKDPIAKEITKNTFFDVVGVSTIFFVLLGDSLVWGVSGALAGVVITGSVGRKKQQDFNA